MGFQLQRMGFWVFLLSALSFCQGKNVTVKVVGLINCTECINKVSSGLNISMHCKSGNRETKTYGNGAIDTDGNFNITLSTEILEGGSSILGCYMKLYNASDSLCPIHSIKIASIKLVRSEYSTAQDIINMMHDPLNISPVTCQSAFFCPFINYTSHSNITYFPKLPPFPTCGQPSRYAQPPVPAAVDLIPSPAPLPTGPYSPLTRPVPPTVPPLAPASGSISSPQPGPNFTVPPPLLQPRIPASSSPQNPPTPALKISPSPSPSTLDTPPFPPPPSAGSTFNQPLPPPQTFHQTPSASPTSAPQNPYATPPPSPTASSNPPNYRKLNPIPRAPPVPNLPPVPTVQRKYFNQPKSNAQPPHPSYFHRS